MSVMIVESREDKRRRALVLAMVRPLTMMNDDVGYGEPSVTTFDLSMVLLLSRMLAYWANILRLKLSPMMNPNSAQVNNSFSIASLAFWLVVNKKYIKCVGIRSLSHEMDCTNVRS
nr:hypothetical protein CFP56_56132 [Quercus suber]